MNVLYTLLEELFFIITTTLAKILRMSSGKLLFYILTPNIKKDFSKNDYRECINHNVAKSLTT